MTLNYELVTHMVSRGKTVQSFKTENFTKIGRPILISPSNSKISFKEINQRKMFEVLIK